MSARRQHLTRESQCVADSGRAICRRNVIKRSQTEFLSSFRSAIAPRRSRTRRFLSVSQRVCLGQKRAPQLVQRLHAKARRRLHASNLTYPDTKQCCRLSPEPVTRDPRRQTQSRRTRRRRRSPPPERASARRDCAASSKNVRFEYVNASRRRPRPSVAITMQPRTRRDSDDERQRPLNAHMPKAAWSDAAPSASSSNRLANRKSQMLPRARFRDGHGRLATCGVHAAPRKTERVLPVSASRSRTNPRSGIPSAHGSCAISAVASTCTAISRNSSSSSGA